MEHPLELTTERLRLQALGVDALQAWIDRDAPALRSLTSAAFDDDAEPPPLLDEDLEAYRDRTASSPDEAGWGVWLITARADACPQGACGLQGRPEDGTVLLGYSVYRKCEGRGVATEASRALVRWIFGHPEAARVRARVPPSNLASLAVARKLGMSLVGADDDPAIGKVAVYEVTRPPAPT